MLPPRDRRPAWRSHRWPPRRRRCPTPWSSHTPTSSSRCCNDHLIPPSTCRSATPSAWPKPAPSLRSGPGGTSYDNALAETIIGLYKTELIRRPGPWKGIDDVEYATLEWVDWFNHRRLLEPIRNVPPAEFEAAHYEGEVEPGYAARLRELSLR
jgi:transposase InsO family protein